LIAGLLLSAPLWLPLLCPVLSVFITAEKRALLDLKNRTALPGASDYDPRATLAALLDPGSDRQRWSENRAARLEGYVVGVKYAGVELANCFAFNRRDIHIDVAMKPGSAPRERMILEVTPPIRDWARARGLDWSVEALQRLIGKRAQFEGWLMFDSEHDEESENTRPGRPGNWRATAWEVHPVTAIKLLE
jgi:hypothetical protein